ncbi:MAG TPA: hypothetical protein VKE69_01790, partial [Planctomycetota bacterium]|nr:hypothetical protein [Planctomycetota bacterium]
MIRVALLALATLPSSSDDKPFVLRADRIHTLAGPTIEGGAVVVAGGRIVAVGASVDVPRDAIELRGAHLTPGLIDASSVAGLRGTGVEESSEITPSHRAIDDVDAASVDFERLVRRGVTTIFVGPGNRSVIGGLGAVLKTAPLGAPRVLAPESALKMTLGPEPSQGNSTPRNFQLPRGPFVRRPNGRPAVVAAIRQALFDAERAVARGGDLDPDTARLADALRGRLPVRVFARELIDLRAALRLQSEFKLKMQIEGAFEAHRYLPELKAAGVPLILGPAPVDPFGTPFEAFDEEPTLRLVEAVAAAGI